MRQIRNTKHTKNSNRTSGQERKRCGANTCARMPRPQQTYADATALNGLHARIHRASADAQTAPPSRTGTHILRRCDGQAARRDDAGPTTTKKRPRDRKRTERHVDETSHRQDAQTEGGRRRRDRPNDAGQGKGGDSRWSALTRGAPLRALSRARHRRDAEHQRRQTREDARKTHHAHTVVVHTEHAHSSIPLTWHDREMRQHTKHETHANRKRQEPRNTRDSNRTTGQGSKR